MTFVTEIPTIRLLTISFVNEEYAISFLPQSDFSDDNVVSFS